MGAFTAVELDPRAICTISFGNILFKWACFGADFYKSLELFSGYSFWSTGVVLKRTEMFVCSCGTLRSLSSDSSSQLNVPGHDGDLLCMDGAQVGVFKQPYKIGLCCFLKT